MTHSVRLTAVAVVVAVCLPWPVGRHATVQAQAAPQVLSNDDVVQMVVGKVAKNLILTMIQTDKNSFDISANGLVALYTSRVPSDLIKAMFAAAAPSKEVLTNDAVVNMVASQLPKDLVITKIQTTAPGFDVSPGGLVSLRQSKVPKDIVDAMYAASTKPAAASVSEAPSHTTSAAPPGTGGGGSRDEAAPEVERARSALNVDRQPDRALEILQKVQESHPNSPTMLVEMGRAYLAEGDGADAKDAFQRVLRNGGQIALELQHFHAVAYCVGTLYISAAKILWVSDTTNTESLDVATSVVTAGSAANYFSLLIDARRWNFEYLLYGKAGSYKPGGVVRPLAYSYDDQLNAKKADAILEDLAVNAKSTVVSAPAPARATAPTPAVAPTPPAAPTPRPAAGLAPAPPPVTGSASPATPKTATSARPNLTEGESPDDVQKQMGKPSQVLPDAKDTASVVWMYPTMKVTFYNNKLVDVTPIKAGGGA
jgi:Tetratricopeptide repeat